MCGIAGWIAPAVSSPGRDTLASMLRAIAHRGPDDEGMRRFHCAATGHEVFLGHRRLAIIDPLGARQPMCDDAAGLALTFNGEIYNFRELRDELARLGCRFVRDSDTEVLLRAYQRWGAEAVTRLRGQFAFAIWDAPRQSLFLARDRFGEKPLFLCEEGGSLFFASEIKALQRVPGIAREVDLESVWDYLAYRYVPAPRTLFRGIRKLMPGSVATWQCGQLTHARYWSPPDREPRAPGPGEPDPASGFLRKLDESVRLQMVSDVPFGAFLSGGLDSSTIVALMSRHGSRINTFSVGFAEDGYSELPYAAAVAAQYATQHHELKVSHRDVTAHIGKLVAFRDAPVSEPSDVPIYLLAREASRSVKMVLTGEGGDEILGGYPKHVAERFVASYQRLPAPLRRRVLEPLARALPYRFRRVKTAVRNMNVEDWRERYVGWFGALDHAGRERLSVLRANGAAPEDEAFDSDPRNSSLRRILHFDQSSWLPDNLLERADRMTMAASIEARVPFLDHHLAEFVSTLPDRYRVRGLRGKWILRRAARRLLPERILSRPKVGFRVPVNEWFRGDLRDFLADHLRGASSMTRAYFEPHALDRVLDEHWRGRQNSEKLLWSLLNLEIWHRQHASS